MRRSAAIDLVLLAIAFWGLWSLRFLGVELVGVITMAGGAAIGLALHRMRGWSWAEIGLRISGSAFWNVRRALEAGALIFLVGAAGIAAMTVIGATPQRSAVLEEQPLELSAYLIDLVVGGWIGAGLGEELFFRGLLLDRFRRVFGGGRYAVALAIIAQAVWFGAGHTSQGVGGVIAIIAVGVAIAAYYLTRARKSLIPVIIGHALVDTVALTTSFLARA